MEDKIDWRKTTDLDTEDGQLAQAVLRLNGNIFGIVLGITLSLLIFIATIWLVIKGGINIGSHLNLLGQFYIGYSVSVIGSLIGAVYGFITGYILGFLIAWIYNRIVFWRSGK